MMLYDFNPYWILIFALLAIGLIVLAAVLISRVLKKKSEQSDSKTEQKTSEITENETSAENAEIQPNQKMMGFGEAIKTCFKKYFSFRGCATRAEYWWFHLFVCGISSALLVPAFIALSKQNYTVYLIFMILDLVFTVATFLPAFSVSVRRMHDTGNMGVFIVIPIANIINLFMPSLESSEYRSEYNIHPTANFFGKAFVIFSLVIYVLYMGAGLSTVYFLSTLQGMDSTDYESTDDDDDVSQSFMDIMGLR